MSTEINTKGFIVGCSGDRSVGIFPQTWQITGDFEFQEAEDLECFKEKIQEAFEYCAGELVGIVTIEEHIANLEREER